MIGIAPESLLAADVTAGEAVDRSCTQRSLSGAAGVAQRTVTMPAAGRSPPA